MNDLERLSNVLRQGLCVTAKDGEQLMRAILTALREPSEGMLDAAYQPGPGQDDDAIDIWQAMIDHILGEGK